MQTAEQIVDQALAIGTRRSSEYWAGMLDVLRFRLQGRPVCCPYGEGTAQFYAYFSGNARGHVLANDYRPHWIVQ